MARCGGCCCRGRPAPVVRPWPGIGAAYSVALMCWRVQHGTQQGALRQRPSGVVGGSQPCYVCPKGHGWAPTPLDIRYLSAPARWTQLIGGGGAPARVAGAQSAGRSSWAHRSSPAAEEVEDFLGLVEPDELRGRHDAADEGRGDGEGHRQHGSQRKLGKP